MVGFSVPTGPTGAEVNLVRGVCMDPPWTLGSTGGTTFSWNKTLAPWMCLHWIHATCCVPKNDARINKCWTKLILV